MNFEVIPLPVFEKQLKRLAKKYRNIKDDTKDVERTLLNNPTAGEPIPGLGNKVFKLRVASSDMERGKRGGFRVIYYLMGAEGIIYLLTIYAKVKKEKVNIKELKKVLTEYGLL